MYRLVSICPSIYIPICTYPSIYLSVLIHLYTYLYLSIYIPICTIYNIDSIHQFIYLCISGFLAKDVNVYNVNLETHRVLPKLDWLFLNLIIHISPFTKHRNFISQEIFVVSFKKILLGTLQKNDEGKKAPIWDINKVMLRWV